MMKKPRPSIARSVGRSVDSKLPWLKICPIRATVLPAPVCEKPPAVEIDCPRTSANSARLSLKPGVLTLAMLSPITEIAVEALSRPLTLLNMALERDMGFSS